MKILCWLLNHMPEDGYGGFGSRYFDIWGTETDGVGRVHAYLWTKCRWCGQKYHVGNVHLPEVKP